MKTKLLKRLRKLAKEDTTLKCEIVRNDTKYDVRNKHDWSLKTFNSKDEAINYLNKRRREFILREIDNIREEKLNKELSKI